MTGIPLPIQRTNSISRSEWRWVIIVSGLLVTLIALPYALAFASDSRNANLHFMGILVNPLDGATYLSKIREGMTGSWLYTFQFTTEANQGAVIHEFYLFLGHLARLMGFSQLQVFHISRLVTSILMFLSFYHLGAVIWPRVRPRRLFFGLLAIGSGLGWLALIALGSDVGTVATDIWMPETIPLYAAFTNPHFPLTIAFITLIASIFIVAFRPGFNEQPTASNGGLMLILLVIGLAIVQPQGLVGILAGLCVYIMILVVRMRRIPAIEAAWTVIAILPALPFAVYYLAAVRQDPAMLVWNSQNITASPPIWAYLIGFGLILLVAIPGIWRGIRHFERDGDRFMVVWLIVNAIILYLPFNLQRRAAIGLIIPVVYFAVRALEDYWFPQLSYNLRRLLMLALFVFVVPSNILVMAIHMSGIANAKNGQDANTRNRQENFILLDNDHVAAIFWLKDHALPNEIVLAESDVSLWIPANTDLRVVYGHPYETLYAETKKADVKEWFAGNKCQEVISTYGVNYVVSSLIQDGTPPTYGCYSELGQPVTAFGQVYIYKVS
jgi:hypothetical protein